MEIPVCGRPYFCSLQEKVRCHGNRIARSPAGTASSDCGLGSGWELSPGTVGDAFRPLVEIRGELWEAPLGIGSLLLGGIPRFLAFNCGLRKRK